MEGQLFEAEPERPHAGATRTGVPPEHQPLPVRMRPATLDEVVGQEHVLGEGSALRRAIEEGQPHSMILYGPPGSGKTTIARLLAGHADAAFEEASAVEAGAAPGGGGRARAGGGRRGGGRAP